ncbi:uncharacterized protein N7482_009466 [Penicillium canariense]|uniref:EGF-like domain-containing protein n=1 Tax=Penicillium canariense TaxID=189055 RepID=A0A9W9HMN4_9EURO|nr:uncharacterized protein N7482_009466 [Penicillium canariense]KAJ5152988.1 hypothetical protein N7482_009466 [Penicillium canariense]
MSARPARSGGPSPSPSNGDPDRKGSVKRARELLEAGVRPPRASPPALIPRPPPPPESRPSPGARNIAHQTQWPLPASDVAPRPLHPQPLNPQHPRFLAPRGPPPSRPRRPSEVPSQIPSPSIYSVRSCQDSELSLNNTTRPARSFSHPKPIYILPQQVAPPSTTDEACASPTSTVDLTPRISIATDELFHRQSTASASPSVPDVPPIPLPEPSHSLDDCRRRIAGLAPPANARRSSISPIPEESPGPRQTLGSLASSRAIPSSWGSGPAASEILGAYLDDGSDDENPQNDRPDENVTLVRNASLGKRGKPTMRTIMKSNPTSEVDPIPDVPSANPQEEHNRHHAAGGLAVGAAVSQVLHAPSTGRRTSVSTGSDESFVDPEKPRFAQPHDHQPYDAAYEKEMDSLPQPAPTMSDKRPAGKKPPRLDMNAVRDAEARGSLSSLSDLIRRATKLASNLDRGRTVSRSDLVNGEADYKAAMGGPGRRRGSGSLSDILASFPNPGLQTPEGRSSWPVFFGRSGLRNVEALGSGDDDPNVNTKAKQPARRCCGMPRKWFILFCMLLFIIVVLAILLPVFLIAVPNQKHSSASSCASSNPCQNGGVSVSSGSECSCVCSNGYTGSQCTVSGDSSCVSSTVDNGTISKNATMGSDLPAVLSASESKFGISLDAVTIMALFNMNNISCQTENALVSFDVDTSSDKTRRAVTLPLDLPASADEESNPLLSLGSMEPTPTALVPRSLATSNGIIYDNSGVSSSTHTASAASTTATAISATTTGESKTQATTTATSTGVPSEVVQFSQVVVLYILQKTGSIPSAMSSESEIETYLTDSYADATHPTLELMGMYGLDFEKKTITLRNGTVVS